MSKFDPDAYLGGTTAPVEEKKKRGGFDPDAYLAAPRPAQPQETAAQTLGRSAASTIDTVLGIPGAIVSPVAYAGYRFKQGVESLANAATGKGFLPTPTAPAEEFARQFEWKNPANKFSVGNITGTANTASYQNAPVAAAGQAIGQVVGENVVQPLSNITGLPEADVGNMLGTLSVPLAGPAGRAAAATGRAAKATAQVPVDVARGALGRATGYIAKPGETPTGYQVPSSRIPLGETFIPAAEMTQLRQGMPISEASVRPISELAPAPIMALSGGEIPVAGQAARAFGERLGETYRNPLTAAADIGSVFLTGGIPVLTAGRGALGLAQAGADAYLARKGFTSLTPAQRQALDQGINPFYTAPAGPVAPAAAAAAAAAATAAPIVNTQPLLPYTPAGQTAMPMPGPGRRVNIEGESFNLPYEIDTSRVQAARPQQPIAGPIASVPEAQPAPVITTQPVKPLTVEPTIDKTPEQLAAEQKILDFINARRGAAPEPTPEPKPEPKKRISQEQRIREREAQMTEEEKAAQEATAKRIVEKSMGKKSAAESTPQYANAAAMRKALFGTMPDDQLEALINKTFPSVETLKQKMATPAAEDKAMSEALRQRLEALKQQGKYRGPKDTSQMMISPDDMTPSQQAFKQQEMMDTMSGKPTYGEYFDAQGNKIVYQERYPNMPDFVKNKAADRDVPIVRKFDPEGNRIPMGEDWSASDPAPVSVAVKKRLSKEPYDLYWENDGEIIRERGNLNKPFKHDPTVTIKRVEQTQNPVGGDDAIVMQAYGKTRRGEEVTITEYGDGTMKGTYTDAKGKQRHRIY